MTPFITSKKGQIEKLALYKYKLTEDVINQTEQCQKFKKWLTKSDDIKLYELNEKDFKTFQPMKEETTWQYNFESSIEIFTPFSNTQQISAYISFIINEALEKKYPKFLKENAHVTDIVDLSPFVLKKAIEFNVELFSSGELFIHFLPTTKITSSDNITFSYIQNLKNGFTRPADDIEISLVESKRYWRLKVDLNSKDDIEKSQKFINDHENVIATFNYHFIASYSPDIFGKVVQETIKDIDKSIFYLQEKLENISFDGFLNFQEKPFQRINIKSFGKENNLLIGENKCVNKQSAAYYSGMFKPANNCIILPVLIDNYNEPSFSELVNRFNKNSENFELLEPVRVKSSSESRFAEVISIRRKYKKKFLAAIFTEYQQPNDFIEPLKKSRTSYQIYLGAIDNFKLSNFTVKCLEKLGGHLSVINNSQENELTYFVGIDLGHSQNERGKFSNLALVFFDNKGTFIHSAINKNLPRNEAISSEVIWSCFTSFRKHLKQNNLPYPEKLIIHRDGKLHPDDIKSIVKQSKKQLSVDNVEVLEIIKRGYPVFACFDKEVGAYMNLKSGDCFLYNDYAILITNIQADEKNAIVNPIIIKHKIGTDNMEKLTEQVYWFTRIYTNNLYNSTRLPATTLKANNIVGTSLKVHYATYEG
ncbi:MAG: hypothetical protein H8E34_02365 [Bacteroidetes bacterium]|nr:hypothetical protein [Bacteroidota bacterium]